MNLYGGLSRPRRPALSAQPGRPGFAAYITLAGSIGATVGVAVAALACGVPGAAAAMSWVVSVVLGVPVFLALERALR
jgi:phosphoribosylcarboxyaminoimidazole (NCAIR) mutase